MKRFADALPAATDGPAADPSATTPTTAAAMTGRHLLLALPSMVRSSRKGRARRPAQTSNTAPREKPEASPTLRPSRVMKSMAESPKAPRMRAYTFAPALSYSSRVAGKVNPGSPMPTPLDVTSRG